jgi:hypothetical protein
MYGLTFNQVWLKTEVWILQKIAGESFCICVSVFQKDGKSDVGLAAITRIKCTNFHSPWFFILLISHFCLIKSECTECLKNLYTHFNKKGNAELIFFLERGRIPVCLLTYKTTKCFPVSVEHNNIVVFDWNRKQLYCLLVYQVNLHLIILCSESWVRYCSI